MLEIAKGAWDDIEAAAKEMLVAKKEIAPVLSPGGLPMVYVTTKRSLLRIALMEDDVNGVKIFVGIPVGK